MEEEDELFTKSLFFLWEFFLHFSKQRINRTHHNKHEQEDEVRPYGDMEDLEPLDTYADEEDDIDLVEQSISQFLAVHCSAEEHHH